VLVLWAPGFDEVAATVFVTALRTAGLSVKLVSLSRQLACGSHGLGLVPDLTLEEALPLAGAASCIILPCNPPLVRRLAMDPRIRELLGQALTHHATLVVSVGSDAILNNVAVATPVDGDLVTFTSQESILQRASELAGALVLAI
jgi:putative intracellular protease/amidase